MHGCVGSGTHFNWRIAYGSALEAGSAMSLLDAAGAVDSAQAAKALILLDRVRAMTWRLLYPAR